MMVKQYNHHFKNWRCAQKGKEKFFMRTACQTALSYCQVFLFWGIMVLHLDGFPCFLVDYKYTSSRCFLYHQVANFILELFWSKTKLREETGISSSSLAKLGKGDNVTTDVLLKICSVMDCGIEDIMETVKD